MNAWKVAATVVAIVAASSVGVYAYDTFVRQKDNDYETVNRGYYRELIDKGDGVICQDSNKDIQASITSYKVSEHEAVMVLNVKSVDGSPLFNENQNMVANLSDSGFASVKVSIDGGDYSDYMIDGEKHVNVKWTIGNPKTGIDYRMLVSGTPIDTTEINYEIIYQNYEVSLLDKNLSCKLSSFGSEYYMFQKAGYVPTDIKTLLSNVEPGEACNIAFSEEYPTSYISEYGFYANDYFKETQSFYMDIVCGNKKAGEEIQDVVFQSKVTGMKESYSTEVLDDGRIRVIYNVNYMQDYVNKGDYKNTTIDDLANMVLKVDAGKQYMTTSMDELNLTFKLEKEAGQVASIDVNPYVDVTSTLIGEIMNVENVTFDGFNLRIQAHPINWDWYKFLHKEDIPGESKQSFGETGEWSPQIIMKSGEVIKFNSIHGGVGQFSEGDRDCYYDMEWMIDKVLDVGQVENIVWHGTVLYSAE